MGQTDCLPSGCHTTSVPATGYNLASQLVSLNYPDGRNVTTGYNTAGRLTGVNLAAYNGAGVNVSYFSVPQSTSASNWGYLPAGEMNRGTYGNGYIETTGYNNRMQIGSITEIKGTSTLLSKTYGYYDPSGHNNGDVLTITDVLSSAKSQTYTYDQLNRLATAVESDNAFNITFNIDPWGNMNESGTSNFAQAFDATNRMSGWNYDAAGNLLNDVSHSYTYDGESRIKTVDGTGATYTYGPGGERVRKDTPSGSTEYIYFGGMIAELNPATGAWTDYISAAGKRVAKDTSANASGAQYYHGDHLGSTRLMTDANGTLISSCTYAPFGEQVGCSPDNTSNHYRFTSKERDAETNVDYFGARYYGSSMGRFLTPDWSEGPAAVPYAHLENPQTLNLYSYVDNNPINAIDADGHSGFHENIMAGPKDWGENSGIELTSTSDDLGSGALGPEDPNQAQQQDASSSSSSAEQAHQNMSLSQDGLDFIKGYEKFSATVYDASGQKHLGDWTIGWGHKTTQDAAPVTVAQADAILAKDVRSAVNAVNHGLRVSVAQNQFDALVSLAFNAGAGSVAAKNQMMRAVNSGSVTEANFTAYRYSGHDKNGAPIVNKGLIRRREDEYKMYSEGKY